MKKIFLVDGDSVYTYQNLLDDIKNRDWFYKSFKYKNLYDFYVNFIIGLASGASLTLLDHDISDAEVESLSIENLNEKGKVTKDIPNTFGELVDLINQSSSEISIFTSGTTGQPKKVTHSITSLTRGVRQSDNHSSDIWGFAYNPTHMAGLQVFFQAFMNTNTLINIFEKERSEILDAIGKYGITHISATPTFYRLLRPVEKTYPEVKRISFGGERSNEELYKAISSMFTNAKITNIYASTEAGTLFASKGESFLIPEKIKHLVKVIDDELLLHKSLVGNSDSFTFKNDYYHTGDIIEWIREEEGLFKFKSRKNEMVNVGGYKVNPAEVEDAIRKIPFIKDVKVYGKPNSILGNVLCADIVSEHGDPSGDKEYILSNLKNELQDFKIPRRIIFVEKIDLTRTGKIKR